MLTNLIHTAIGDDKIVPDFVPNTFHPLPEEKATAVEMFGLKYKLEDLKALEGKNAFVNFQDGTYAIGLIANVTSDCFDIGTTERNIFSFVSNFREV
jgi:hypothetical protein